MFEKNPKASKDSNKRTKTVSASKTPPPTPAASSGNQSTTIGASIKIRGELSGEENLVIQGNVEGAIKLKDHSVSVGEQGRIHADVYAKSIIVQGELSGDLYGTENVTIARSGRVNGNIVAPRVILEDGAKFKGSIDMDSKPVMAPRTQETAGAPVKATTA
jgi:cytoskeletal protein CcmA (bactofilin family)